MAKKSVRDMEATVAEQRARTQKSEREYTTLKESIEGMKRHWKSDIDAVREEVNRRDEKSRADGAVIAKKYRKMADELKASQTGGESIKKMKAEDEKIRKELEDGFRDQIKTLKEEMAKQAKENSEAVDTARFVVSLLSRVCSSSHVHDCRELALELGRLRRLMRVAGTVPEPPGTNA
jgi:chromosome segregation ATPase